MMISQCTTVIIAESMTVNKLRQLMVVQSSKRLAALAGAGYLPVDVTTIGKRNGTELMELEKMMRKRNKKKLKWIPVPIPLTTVMIAIAMTVARQKIQTKAVGLQRKHAGIVGKRERVHVTAATIGRPFGITWIKRQETRLRMEITKMEVRRKTQGSKPKTITATLVGGSIVKTTRTIKGINIVTTATS